MYTVLENDIPVDSKHFKDIHPSWNQSTYDKMKDAVAYTRQWVGALAYRLPKSWKGEPIEIIEGMVIQIKKMK